MTIHDHGVTDDDGNLLLGQRGDGSPIWDHPEDPLPLRRVAHFTEQDARCKAWELAGAGYGPTGISKLHHSGIGGVNGMDWLREIDTALAALVDVKPLAQYGEPGTYDTVQARRQRALAQAEQSLLNLRRELAGKAGVQEVPRD
jgi:hypothetical protein